MIVAVMTQSLRAHYCAEFLHRRSTDGKVVAIVANRRAFDGVELPPAAEIVYTGSSPTALPSERVLGSALARRALLWMRGGSGAGARAERAIRSLMWRLRYVDRVSMLVGARRTEPEDADHVTRALEALESRGKITEIVAFDVFDLPGLLAYTEGRDIAVRLR